MGAMSQPWYRDVTRQQWKTFLTTFAAWTLDAFDFTILTFVLIDIQQSFSVNKGLAGLLGTVTLIFRVFGGIGAGTLADRYGRKGPILFSIAWYTAFAFLSGMSTSYVMLFAFRGLFGIGMGGMWAAGMPLALEQWPAKHRGIASGILQAGYSTGFLLSSLVYQLAYPLVSDRPEWTWRLMLWAGVLPAIVVFVLMQRVPESPVWIAQRRKAAPPHGSRWRGCSTRICGGSRSTRRSSWGATCRCTSHPRFGIPRCSRASSSNPSRSCCFSTPAASWGRWRSARCRSGGVGAVQVFPTAGG